MNYNITKIKDNDYDNYNNKHVQNKINSFKQDDPDEQNTYSSLNVENYVEEEMGDLPQKISQDTRKDRQRRYLQNILISQVPMSELKEIGSRPVSKTQTLFTSGDETSEIARLYWIKQIAKMTNDKYDSYELLLNSTDELKRALSTLSFGQNVMNLDVANVNLLNNSTTKWPVQAFFKGPNKFENYEQSKEKYNGVISSEYAYDKKAIAGRKYKGKDGTIKSLRPRYFTLHPLEHIAFNGGNQVKNDIDIGSIVKARLEEKDLKEMYEEMQQEEKQYMNGMVFADSIQDAPKKVNKAHEVANSDIYEIYLGTFNNNTFTWYSVAKYKDSTKAYKEFKKYVNTQLQYTDQELKKVWDTGRLDVELRKGNKLLNWVGIYSREVKYLSEKEKKESETKKPDKQSKKDSINDFRGHFKKPKPQKPQGPIDIYDKYGSAEYHITVDPTDEYVALLFHTDQLWPNQFIRIVAKGSNYADVERKAEEYPQKKFHNLVIFKIVGDTLHYERSLWSL